MLKKIVSRNKTIVSQIQHIHTFTLIEFLVVIAIIALLAAMLLPVAVLSASEFRYVRTVEESFPEAPKREKAIPGTMIFAERQPYTYHSNFMNYYIDRPLFSDRELRDLSQKDGGKENYLRDIAAVRSYEINGFCSLSYPGIYKDNLKFMRESGENPVMQGYSDLLALDADNGFSYDSMRNMVEDAVNSPYAARVNGKVVLWHYGWLSADATRKLAAKLRADKAIGDKFLIFTELPFMELYNIFTDRYKTGKLPIPQEYLDKFKKDTQEALAAGDGLVMRINENSSDAQHDYGYTIHATELYRDYLLPITLELMSLPENRGKLLGAYINQGYINHFAGWTYGKYGTRSLRVFLDEAVRFNPDVLVLFEWNEFNENTCFMPTLSTGTALRRLIRYYSRRLNHEPTTPIAGDDLSVPNLVFSCRQAAKLGDAVHYELLNIPDNDGKATYQARLMLKDEDGKLIYAFPEETFTVGRLTAVSYRVPTEQLSEHTVLVPELTTVNVAGVRRVCTGFDSTRLSATANCNYNETRHALRDTLQLRQANFTVQRNADGTFDLAGKIQADEELSSIEVVDCGDEVFSVDTTNEFDPDKFVSIYGTFSSLSDFTDQGTITVKNVSAWRLRSTGAAWGSFDCRPKDDIVEVSTQIYPGRAAFVLSIPKAEAANAELVINYDRGHSNGPGEEFIPLRGNFKIGDVIANGRYAKLLTRNTRLDLERADDLPDYPVKLRARSAEFKYKLRSSNKFPNLQLRVISESGKIYRGAPIVPIRPSGEKVDLNVFSEYDGKVITVKVNENAIPDLEYIFDPKYGDALVNRSADRFYDGQLGGGFIYLEPACNAISRLGIPKDFDNLNPKWKRDGKDWVLDFDGNSDYVNLPRETIPRGPFTLEFEIKPADDSPRTLFRHFSYGTSGSIQLFFVNGVLEATFDSFSGVKRFNTGLAVPKDKWSKVKIAYDYRNITFSVNDQSKTYEYFGRSKRFAPATFGGLVEKGDGFIPGAGFFKGQLRALRICHNVKKQ